jgi:predicted acyl esterase
MEKKDNRLNVNPFHFKDVPLRESKFIEYEKSSQYLTMRDGVKIAVELVLPKNLSSEDNISIILMQTRYS